MSQRTASKTALSSLRRWSWRRPEMSYDVYLLLIGAGKGLVCPIIGALVQHCLSLRTERKKMAWAKEDSMRQSWVEGAKAGGFAHERDAANRTW
jgi:hypothetical protein